MYEADVLWSLTQTEEFSSDRAVVLSSLTPHMPTSRQNMHRVLYNDWERWSDRTDDVNERFSVWLAR